MPLHIRNIIISCLVIILGRIYFSVFAAQQNVNILPWQTIVVNPATGQYLYIQNKASRTAFVPYTYPNGISYGCPTFWQTWALRNISNTPPWIVNTANPWIVSGPAARWIDISCWCPNPNPYDFDNPAVPHLRSGNFYNAENGWAIGCALHMAHLSCDNGVLNNTTNNNPATGYIYTNCVACVGVRSPRSACIDGMQTRTNWCGAFQRTSCLSCDTGDGHQPWWVEDPQWWVCVCYGGSIEYLWQCVCPQDTMRQEQSQTCVCDPQHAQCWVDYSCPEHYIRYNGNCEWYDGCIWPGLWWWDCND